MYKAGVEILDGVYVSCFFIRLGPRPRRTSTLFFPRLPPLSSSSPCSFSRFSFLRNTHTRVPVLFPIPVLVLALTDQLLDFPRWLSPLLLPPPRRRSVPPKDDNDDDPLESKQRDSAPDQQKPGFRTTISERVVGSLFGRNFADGVPIDKGPWT